MHPLYEQPTGIIDNFIIKLDFELFPKINIFESLITSSKDVSPINLQILAPILPRDPNILNIEPKP